MTCIRKRAFSSGPFRKGLIQHLTEAANRGVLQIICSAPARKLKIFEEHLLGGPFVHFNSFFQNFSCRTHHNFARKQNFVAEHIKILPGSLEIKKILHQFHIFIC